MGEEVEEEEAVGEEEEEMDGRRGAYMRDISEQREREAHHQAARVVGVQVVEVEESRRSRRWVGNVMHLYIAQGQV